MQIFLRGRGFKPMPMLEGRKWQVAASAGKKLEPAAQNIQSSGICCIVCLDHVYSLIRSGLKNEADCGLKMALFPRCRKLGRKGQQSSSIDRLFWRGIGGDSGSFWSGKRWEILPNTYAFIYIYTHRHIFISHIRVYIHMWWRWGGKASQRRKALCREVVEGGGANFVLGDWLGDVTLYWSDTFGKLRLEFSNLKPRNLVLF